jgi:hypothetical protein
LTIREFQRAFSKCGGRRETYHCANETGYYPTPPQYLPTRGTNLHPNTCAGSWYRHVVVADSFSQWSRDVRASP